MMKKSALIIIPWIVLLLIPFSACANDQIPTGSPLMTDSAGNTERTAVRSVFRVVNTAKQSAGTAFLHRSGKVITAAHIVIGATPEEILLIQPTGHKTHVEEMQIDETYDLALLTPRTTMAGDALKISTSTSVSIGSQCITWGFPAGYRGLAPLLGVGYIAGVDNVSALNGTDVRRWVVNAAFNSGNSGGPVVDTESGSVIGVVCSKVAPIPPSIESALQALNEMKSGFQYTYTASDGTEESISEAQVIGWVLSYLRSQTQLVIGHAATLDHIRSFLKANSVEP